MARQKAKRRKKTPKKFNWSSQIVGIIFIGWSLLGMFQAGFLGTACLNVFRLLIGDLGLIGLILLLIWGIYLLALGKEPRISSKRYWGIFLIICGSCLWLSVWLFSKLELHTHFINITWQYLWSDLSSNSAGSHVGGGMLGSLLYSGTYFLVGQFGSYLIAVLLVMGGFCFLVGLSFSKMLHRLFYGLVWLISQIISGLQRAFIWSKNQVSALYTKHQNNVAHKKSAQAAKIMAEDAKKLQEQQAVAKKNDQVFKKSSTLLLYTSPSPPD